MRANQPRFESLICARNPTVTVGFLVSMFFSIHGAKREYSVVWSGAAQNYSAMK